MRSAGGADRERARSRLRLQAHLVQQAGEADSKEHQEQRVRLPVGERRLHEHADASGNDARRRRQPMARDEKGARQGRRSGTGGNCTT